MTKLLFLIAQGSLACLPALLVMLISREDPDTAADFSIALGVVGAIFSICYFGQRAYICIRGVETIPGRAAISFRFFFSLVAGAATFAVVGGMQLGLAIAALAVAIKLSEGIVDVWVGLRIHTSSEEQSSSLFATVAVVRALLIVIPVLLIGAASSVGNVALVAYLVLLAATFYVLAHGDTRRMGITGSYLVRPRQFALHGWQMRSFLAATAACALLTTSPRLVLPFSEHASYRSAALSLSIVPVYGLACQAIWLSNVKAMAIDFSRHARKFILEMSVVTAAVALLWPAWRLLARVAYGLESRLDQERFCATLLAGVAFTGAIGLSNLFKLSRLPRNESFNYVLGTACIAFCVFALGASVNQALVASSVTMTLYVALLFSMLDLRVSRESEGQPRLPEMNRFSASPAVFIRLCNRPIPRVLRMMMVARDLGLSPYFIGAHREKRLARRDRWDEWEIERIGPYFPLVNGTRPLLYVLSVLRYGLSLLVRLIGLRPSFVHVSDIEAFWPARLYTALTGTPLIFNIHDNLSQRYQCPAFAAGVLNVIEGIAARCATATTVPEEFRRTALPRWCRSNVYVVKNAPLDPGFREPKASEGSDVDILYGGWIDAGRGIVPLIGLIANCEGCHLKLAGEGDPALVEQATAQERVDYVGYLNHKQVIEETEACDFVAAFYDPRRPINRFAASNKIAETLAVGRPLLINSEQKIAELLRDYDCAVIVDYADAESIGAQLLELRADTERYEVMCRNARRAYEEHYAWDIIYRASLDLYAAAGIHAPEHQIQSGPETTRSEAA